MIHAVLLHCDPVFRRLQRNHLGYWHRYRHHIMLVIVAAVGDYLSTLHFMHHDGIHHELHPGIRLAAQTLGPVAGTLLGKFVQLAALYLVTLYLRSIARLLFLAAAMMYGWAAWYNVWGRDLYTPLLIEWLPFT